MVEWIYVVLVFFGGIMLGRTNCCRLKTKIKVEKCLSDKHLEMFLLMNKWFQKKREQKEIGTYLKNMGIQDVAIYGMGYLGRCLYEELERGNFEVKYIIDEKKDLDFQEIKVIQPSDEMETVGGVIVTSIYYFEDLKKELSLKFRSPILSLADIIYKM